MHCILINSLFQELEAHFENTKHELQVTQEALAKFQSSQQVSHILDMKLLQKEILLGLIFQNHSCEVE